VSGNEAYKIEEAKLHVECFALNNNYEKRKMEINPTTHNVYLWGAISILVLSLSASIYASKLMFFHPKETFTNPLLLAMYMLVPPNVVIVACYLSEHIPELLNHSGPTTSPFCSGIAFFSCASMTAIMGGAVILAHTSSVMVFEKSRVHARNIVVGTAISWFVGIFVSLKLYLDGTLGPYQGLYCCITMASFSKNSVIFSFNFLVLSFVAQLILHIRTFRSIQLQDEISALLEANSMDHGAFRMSLQRSNETSTLVYSDHSNPLSQPFKRSSREVVQWSLELIFVFTCCWTLLFINAAAVVMGFSPRVELEILAAWLVKSNGFLYSVLLAHRIACFKKVFFQEPKSSNFVSAKFLKADSLAKLDQAKEKKAHVRQLLKQSPAIQEEKNLTKYIISGVELT